MKEIEDYIKIQQEAINASCDFIEASQYEWCGIMSYLKISVSEEMSNTIVESNSTVNLVREYLFKLLNNLNNIELHNANLFIERINEIVDGLHKTALEFNARLESSFYELIKESLNERNFIAISDEIYYIKNRIINANYENNYLDKCFPKKNVELLSEEENEINYRNALQKTLEKLYIIREYYSNVLPLKNYEVEDDVFVINEFEFSVFWPNSIRDFVEVEKALTIEKYIDKNKKWIKRSSISTKRDLVNLIVLLESKGFFRKMINGKLRKQIHIISFFNDRYKVNVEQEYRRYHKIVNLENCAKIFPYVKDQVE